MHKYPAEPSGLRKQKGEHMAETLTKRDKATVEAISDMVSKLSRDRRNEVKGYVKALEGIELRRKRLRTS